MQIWPSAAAASAAECYGLTSLDATSRHHQAEAEREASG
jgi:hypothetical protein